MACVHINPFGHHYKTKAQPDEIIPLTTGGVGSTWEPEREQETSFRIESQ